MIMSQGALRRPDYRLSPAQARITPEKSIIIGNRALCAIAGECYFRGVAGERFAVRNLVQSRSSRVPAIMAANI